MRTAQRSIPSLLARPAVALLAVAMLSGCQWFRSENVFAEPEATRALEVPPDLDLPNTEGAMPLPGVETGSVTRSSMGTATPASGFTTSGDRDAVFTRVGEILAGTEGVSIASRAQVLGAYDVSYGGSNFLVRISAVEGGAYVSAVDPRGVPAGGEAPAKLIGILQAALGG